MNLTLINLKLAFGLPGCPLCRLSQQAERRYLFHLLYENVNDGGTRWHLVRGWGLCPEHAWALQAIEQEHWHDGLGVSIIYEDLAGRLLRILRSYLDKNPSSRADRQTGLRRGLEHSGRLGRWLARWLLPATPGSSLAAQISAVERCYACHLLGSLAEGDLHALLRGLADPEFRGAYSASDGLCLPHLRRVLASAEDERIVRFLVEVATAKLAPLVDDLGEYVRKHDWNNREEPQSSWEQVSWLRAVAFFAGEAPPAEEEDTYRLRRQALAECHRRGEEKAL